MVWIFGVNIMSNHSPRARGDRAAPHNLEEYSQVLTSRHIDLEW